MKEWMFPTSYNYLQAEASHLIHHADSNQVQFYIHYLNYLNPSGVLYSLAGIEITAGQRTMSGLIAELTSQLFVLPVMLTSHNRSY